MIAGTHKQQILGAHRKISWCPGGPRRHCWLCMLHYVYYTIITFWEGIIITFWVGIGQQCFVCVYSYFSNSGVQLLFPDFRPIFVAYQFLIPCLHAFLGSHLDRHFRPFNKKKRALENQMLPNFFPKYHFFPCIRHLFKPQAATHHFIFYFYCVTELCETLHMQDYTLSKTIGGGGRQW